MKIILELRFITYKYENQVTKHEILPSGDLFSMGVRIVKKNIFLHFKPRLLMLPPIKLTVYCF